MYQMLEGLTVIEASSFVASPSAGLYLAQMGTEVIRIDQIGGGPDFGRWPRADNGASLYWENLNRAKKSVAIDMTRPEGRALVQALAASTGQFLTNFPVDGFLSHAQLAQTRADLITVRIMGQADGGPALDYTVNAAVGIPQLTGPASLGDSPVNHVLPAWDLLTGAYAAFAMMTALHHRGSSGAGREIRIPLADVAIASVANLGMIAEVAATGQDRERLGNTVYGAFGRDFVTADGKRLMIMAITPRQWRGLVTVLGIAAEIAGIEARHGVSFDSDEGLRYVHRAELFGLVENRVAHWQHDALVAAMTANGCCFGGYQTLREACTDPALVTANPIFSTAAGNPSGLAYAAAGAFAAIPAEPRAPARPAPRLGADTDSVLERLLGMSPVAIGALHDQRLIA
ncbi:MAG: CoA transferase [Polymorphobacter sp.]